MFLSVIPDIVHIFSTWNDWAPISGSIITLTIFSGFDAATCSISTPPQALNIIIGILDRLEPKKIVIVSSSPQVRYPDYYGIDMAKMSEFIAFKAAVELLKEREMRDVIAAAYRKSKEQVGLPKEQMVNYVKEIYAPFTDEEISAKMVELLTPKGTKAKLQIVYQPLEGLHEACPKHPGDWYFSGDYPTPGGVKMLNKAFIDYIEQVYQF